MRRTIALGLLVASACVRKDEPLALRGMMLTPPTAKPNFVFTAPNGTPYDLRRETDGKLTLLFFGYTYCPDVCPMHMSNLAAVMKNLPDKDRDRIRVVFVTTDPERDTPERLRTWIRSFDTTFVGVAGRMDQVNNLQQSMGMPPAAREAATKGSPAGAYGIAHGAAVLAFTPDDSLRALYPFGIRREDWAVDLPKLLRVRPRA